MTNSMIPYSFIPGTKAKAGEVNANFIALANIIEKNKGITTENILEISEILNKKADKTELITNFTVTDAETNLDSYKTVGTYVFSSLYTPLNIPKGTSGILAVSGCENSTIKQIWYCDGTNEEIFTRSYQNSEWTNWQSNIGIFEQGDIGYMSFPNGLLIQWGYAGGKTVTYPIAFSTLACPIALKNGCGTEFTKSDTGFTAESLTGFSYNTSGRYHTLNWIAIGY